MNSNAAPSWFNEAIKIYPEKLFVKVKGVKISYNVWGRKENP